MSYSGSGTRQLQQLSRALSGMGRGSQAALTRALAAESLSLVKRGFDLGESPYGQKWAPVARGGKPLLDTGRLRAAFLDNSTPGVVRISNPTKYAAIHNYGGVVTAKSAPYLMFPMKFQGGGRKKGQWVRVKSVTIPQRQFLPDSRGLPLTWETRLERVARQVVRERMEAGK